MFCRKCGAQINDDAVFCYKCGAEVNKDAADTNLSESEKNCSSHNRIVLEDGSIVDSQTCPACHGHIPIGKKFCTVCGHNLIPVDIPVQQPNYETATVHRSAETPLSLEKNTPVYQNSEKSFVTDNETDITGSQDPVISKNNRKAEMAMILGVIGVCSMGTLVLPQLIGLILGVSMLNKECTNKMSCKAGIITSVIAWILYPLLIASMMGAFR